MASRPNFIDLRSQSQASMASSSLRTPLRSPRLHVAGDVPPELSPLDAFALQSLMLARQLEETSSRDGRRASRLPPLTTSSPLVVQGRSDYFRAMSQDSATEPTDSPETQSAGLGLRTELADPFGADRPMSMHPRMSRIPPTPDEPIPLPRQPIRDVQRGRQPRRPNEEMTFGARREESPAQMDNVSQTERPVDVRKDNSLPTPSASFGLSPKKAGSVEGLTLAPPRPLFSNRSSSAMSSPLEPTSEGSVSGMSSSFHSLGSRKLSSSSSAFSGPALTSPVFGVQRSPSVGSEASAPLPRPSFNFSRPLSRAGTPGLEAPVRQPSSDSQPSFLPAEDTAHTPVSMNSESFENFSEEGKGAPSYIYSKFSLPRGKAIQRSVPLDTQPQASYQWELPIIQPSNVQPILRGAPPSPPTRPSSSSSKAIPGEFSLRGPSMEQARAILGIGGPAPQPSPNPSRPSTDEGRPSEDVPRGRPLTSPLYDTMRGRTPMSTATSDSASTVMPPRSQHSFAPSASELSAEEHLAKGIDCHENGSLNESTYHLRHAAKQHHPTGMLLYALACRHGWGMRPNQKEGVEWLRRAAEFASLEIADDEDQAKDGKFVDALDRKTRKAQFALSIYELGVSHMNGWGIEQDRTLALRCFEIAGAWGDVDALAEAGFCYAQGIGCKKDLKKSAKFYKMAEAKGMSMIGNSWIHKSKYNDDSKEKSKKARSKSRTRALFGLKS